MIFIVEKKYSRALNAEFFIATKHSCFLFIIFIFVGYTLKWEQKIRNIAKEVNLTEGTTSYTIRNLMPTTNYTIYLFGRTAKGSGAVSSADIESGVPPGGPLLINLTS
jgi:hypothetical protein